MYKAYTITYAHDGQHKSLLIQERDAEHAKGRAIVNLSRRGIANPKGRIVSVKRGFHDTQKEVGAVN